MCLSLYGTAIHCCCIAVRHIVVRQVDRAFASKGLLPPWYMTLRLPLTLAAVAGMSMTLVASVRSAEAAIPDQAPRALPGASNPAEMQLAAQSRRGA